MSFLSDLLGKLFRFIYETLNNIGAGTANISEYAMALIVMGLVYKLITIPMTIQQTKNQKRTMELQPKIEELKKKYGYDQQILNQKLQEFQKENNIATAGCSGCLMLIIQLIIVYALFAVVREPGKYLFDNPEQINQISRNFFWINDLSLADPTGFVFALLNSLTQLGVTYLSQNSVTQAAAGGQNTQMMLYMMPILFFFFFRTMPSGLILYWIVGNIVEIVIRGAGRLIAASRANI